MKRQGMAGATYTEATLEEWDTFLKRAFHALHPRRSAAHGEVIYDLFLTPRLSIQIRTTVPTEGAQTRKSGSDIIQVMPYDHVKNRIIAPSSMILKVKRTKNWRDGVRERVEKWMELFDEHDAEEKTERGQFIAWPPWPAKPEKTPEPGEPDPV
jgi:hypothetical protein